MLILLFANWWKSLSIDLHIFLSISIVFSTLLVILYIMSYVKVEEEADKYQEPTDGKNKLLSAKFIITFFTLFGWAGALLSFLWDKLSLTFLYSFILGIAATLLFRWLSSSSTASRNFKMEKALTSTGKVLRSIPPHRNGFGKVHLNIREAPYEIEAVTAGQELPRGASVRVIDILDEKIVLVEPVLPVPGKRARRRFDQKAVRQAGGPPFDAMGNATSRPPEEPS